MSETTEEAGRLGCRFRSTRVATAPSRKVVSKRIRRATVSITLDTCSHANPAMQEKAAALIAGLVFAGR
jgi:hypothetical protein